MARPRSDILFMMAPGGTLAASLALVVLSAAPGTAAPTAAPGAAAPGAQRAAQPHPARATLVPPPLAQSGTELCFAVRRQVLAWSRRAGRGRDRAHVVAIRRPRVLTNQIAESPRNGVLLRCVGNGKLSNGLSAPVAFGMTAVNGTWYLFLRRVRP